MKISLEAFYRMNPTHNFRFVSKDAFVVWIKSALSSIEFIFKTTMHKQTDKVAMESTLGSTLAYIFVLYRKEKLFFGTRKTPTYFR